MRILITGGSGFLGRNLIAALAERFGAATLVYPSQAEYDLRELNSWDEMLESTRPDVVVNFAAKVGGIWANQKKPADLFYDNLLITGHCFASCSRAKVDRLIVPFGGCSYPNDASNPISESALWDGFPNAISAPYSVAKKLAVVAAEAFARQYDLRTQLVIPGNVYGPHDNFSETDGHVIPALISKMYHAKARGLDRVALFGSGRAIRDFVYVRDVVEIIAEIIMTDADYDVFNISSGVGISIQDLARTIAKIVGFNGALDFDSTKPDGQLEKVFDVSRMKACGFSCQTSLEAGLESTYSWFLQTLELGEGLRV